MRIQVKVVRFTLIMSIVLAVITYLITLNIEIGFLCLNTPWLSNNFALTVCGGAFASMLVVLIGEIQKYFLNKKSAEDSIFSHTAFIYGQLNILKTHIQFCLTNPNQIVPGKLLDYTVGIMKNEIAMVSNVDYFSFSQNQLTNEEGAVPLQRAIRYTDDPNAPEMRVRPSLPPLRYADLQAKLKEKKPTIKFGKTFYAALKIIKANKNYCQSNYLDPENKSSTKKDFYTHEAVDALLIEYERLEVTP